MDIGFFVEVCISNPFPQSCNGHELVLHIRASSPTHTYALLSDPSLPIIGPSFLWFYSIACPVPSFVVQYRPGLFNILVLDID